MNPITAVIRSRAPQAAERLRTLGAGRMSSQVVQGLAHGAIFQDMLEIFSNDNVHEGGPGTDSMLKSFDGLLQMIEARAPIVFTTDDLSDAGSTYPIQSYNEAFDKLHAARSQSARRGPFHPRIQGALDVVIEAYACAGYLDAIMDASDDDTRVSPNPVIDESYVIESITRDCPQALISYLRAGADWRHIPSGEVKVSIRVAKYDFQALVEFHITESWARNEIFAVMREHLAIQMRHDISISPPAVTASPNASTPKRISPRSGM